MPQSPALDSEGAVRVSILSNGAPIPDAVRLYSVRIKRGANTIPTAQIVLDDGMMTTGEWAIADGSLFTPGAKIDIRAGYRDAEADLFKGVAVKLAVRISGDNFSRLIVHCQDAAVRMTVGRRNSNYLDLTDSDIIANLARDHGLTASVDATSVEYGELVQYYCTDWDFLVSRAEVNGFLVIADDGELKVKAPQTSQTPVLQVTWGADLVDFQAEIDARSQLSNVKARAWDPKTQAAVTGESGPVELNDQGDLSSATLAGVMNPDAFTLQSATRIETEALTAWAKAQQVKAGLARIRGHMRFQGSAEAKVGDLIDVVGVGARYAGAVLITGLEHEIAEGNWFTTAQFGLSPNWFAERGDVVAPPAAGWLPGTDGLQIGVVAKLDGDPLGEQRIQVTIPVLAAEQPEIWARLMQSYASNGFGAFWAPEVGDEVVLGYFNSDPGNPVVLGSLYSSNRAPPYALAQQNNIKAWVTRSNTKIEINEEDKVVTVATPGKNTLIISDKDQSITLQDQSGNKVTLAPGGITLDSPKDIKLTAKGALSIDAVGSITISSKADVSTQGLNITHQAQVAFAGKGSATAELSASGQTTVRGAMVMIN
ncbi:MAG: type VI secretion system tip protein VgrG [Caulobacteraceae bacterium]